MKPSSASTAYLLISHGSRDVRPAQAMNLLRSMVAERLSFKKAKDTSVQPSTYILRENIGKSGSALIDRAFSGRHDAFVSLLARDAITAVSEYGGIEEVKRSYSGNSRKPYDESITVETACLELSEYPLHHQIYKLGLRLIASGVHELKLAPIFLMAGTHVTQDIPSEIEIAQSMLGDALNLTLCHHLGAHPAMPDVLTKRLASLTTEGSLLVAHGSRRQKGNKAIQSLAQEIDTPVAYWAVPPDIESQVIELMQQGCQGITILPYFLFAGGITDAIAYRTEELAERFPKVTFRLLPPLGATEEIADLIVDLL